MTQNEAVERANRWVLSRYPVVPLLGMVLDFSLEEIRRLENVHRESFSEEDRQRCLGKWCVLYRCSWDTDEQGLPLRLGVLVDDHTGEAEGLWEDGA